MRTALDYGPCRTVGALNTQEDTDGGQSGTVLLFSKVRINVREHITTAGQRYLPAHLDLAKVVVRRGGEPLGQIFKSCSL